MNYATRMTNYLKQQVFGTELLMVLGKTKESFEEKKDSAKDNTTSMFLSIMLLFIGTVYLLVMLALWFRIVYYAFQTGSVREGLSSIFFYKLYVMYFIGSTLSARSNNSPLFVK
jgi:hypothetical protein